MIIEWIGTTFGGTWNDEILAHCSFSSFVLGRCIGVVVRGGLGKYVNKNRNSIISWNERYTTYYSREFEKENEYRLNSKNSQLSSSRHARPNLLPQDENSS